MSVIKKLAPDIASKIAAGEVVERPFNVVKELIENSVDAGATSITVEIIDGGLSLIKITDNGKGIDKEDLPLALERFATSKAVNVEDVYSASTFGFRGEALAAISSVSMFTLRSGKNGETFEIKSKCGEVSDVRPAPAVNGTMVEVINLFESLPARRKFLKGFKKLEGEVVKLVKHFSLINPTVALTLIVNTKEMFSVSTQDDVCIRAAKVFNGKAFVQGVANIGDIEVRIATTPPEISDRMKRDGMIIGVNGRLIKDASFPVAVTQAYHRLVPDGRYPNTVVDIRINPELVDANVHPAKMEVRFENQSEIFSLIKASVTRAIATVPTVPTEVTYGITEQRISSKNIINNTVRENVAKYDYSFNIEDKLEETLGRKQTTSKDEYVSIDNTFTSDRSFIADIINEPIKNEVVTPISEPVAEIVEEKQPTTVIDDYKIIGQHANSYIIVEMADKSVIFIDQHAAHERILFEKNVDKHNTTKQPTIILHERVEVELSDEELEGAEEHIETINSYGYSYDIEGDKVCISSIPLSVARKDFKTQFKNILIDLCVRGISKTVDAPLALLSCKQAIKAGDALSMQDMEYLLKLLFSTNNYATCPHGRPLIFSMTFDEVSRKFLR